METYSPVANLTSIRTVLGIANIEDWELHNMDVQTAFLNSPIEEEIYMRQPIGYTKHGPNGEPLVCKMIKSLYGLKQASRNWNKVKDKWLKNYGFTSSPVDTCLYILKQGNSITVVLL